MIKQRKITRVELEQLLPDGEWIHVVWDGTIKGRMYSREDIFELFDKYGMEVGGPLSKNKNYGIVCNTELRTFFIQNRLEPK